MQISYTDDRPFSAEHSPFRLAPNSLPAAAAAAAAAANRTQLDDEKFDIQRQLRANYIQALLATISGRLNDTASV